MKDAATSTSRRCGWWPIACWWVAPGWSKKSTCDGSTRVRAHYHRVGDVRIDERPLADEVFAGNYLLSTFSPEARALIEPFGSIVQLGTGDVVLNRGEDVVAALFPLDPTLISLVVELSDGRSVEAALIGRRGAVGGIISCGQAPAFARASVLVGGPAFRVPMQALEDAKRRSPFIA